MRFIYLDPGLRHDLGHHANTARFILGALRARGIPTTVFANAKVIPELRAELDAIPLFRAYADRPRDPDPIAGWLNVFDAAARMTIEDLQRIDGLQPNDLVYLSTMYEDLFMGVVGWLNSLAPVSLPAVIGEFCLDTGLDVVVGADNETRYEARDPRVDPRAVLYRYASRHISDAVAPRLQFVACDPGLAAAFQALLQRPVKTLPFPFPAVTQRRNRAGQRPITVAVLGHQRPDKGYRLMAEVAAALLAARSDIRVLAHNGDPAFMPEAQEAMRRLARTDSRVTLDEAIAGPQLWAHLLDQSDLMLCPYHPRIFAARHSSVAFESIANGIPLVVPARTSLAALLREFGEPGTTFDAFTADSVVEAVQRALGGFDRYAERASAASEQWSRTRGPQNFVRSLLELPQSARAALAAG